MHNTHVTPHPPLSRSPFSHWRRLIAAFVSTLTPPTPATPLYAGVQTMRARICSVLSCDMFARVVWLRLRGAVKSPTFALSFAAHARHALLLATNSCTPHGGSEGGRRESSLLTFGTFGHAKVRETQSYYKIKDKTQVPSTAKIKD